MDMAEFRARLSSICTAHVDRVKPMNQLLLEDIKALRADAEAFVAANQDAVDLLVNFEVAMMLKEIG